uniref:Uncharacterized protein n=1 Tax=Arundo donax TaxID=35708 RepID=A0A0A9TD55_ARUDO
MYCWNYVKMIAMVEISTWFAGVTTVKTNVGASSHKMVFMSCKCCCWECLIEKLQMNTVNVALVQCLR